jgi:hypothetical protein
MNLRRLEEIMDTAVAVNPIRDQLSPLIRKYGVRTIAAATGIAHSTLFDWIHGRRGRRLGDQQLDTLALALGAQWRLVVGDTVSPPYHGEKESQDVGTVPQA